MMTWSRPNGSLVQGYMVDTDGSLILDGLGDPQVVDVHIDPNYYNVSIDSNGTVVGLDATTKR